MSNKTYCLESLINWSNFLCIWCSKGVHLKEAKSKEEVKDGKIKSTSTTIVGSMVMVCISVHNLEGKTIIEVLGEINSHHQGQGHNSNSHQGQGHNSNSHHLNHHHQHH